MSRRGAILALAALGLAASASGLAAPASSIAAPTRGTAAPTRAPSGPALTSGASAYAAPAQPGGEAEPESAAGSEDPLVRNGLRSPFCGLVGAGLQAQQAGNCRTSGFLAAAAPSEDYAFDTNIDTTLGVSVDALLQDYLVRPIWMGLVWLTHELLVALEWSYVVDLVRGPLANGLAPLLRGAEAQLTDPWLASLLSIAGILAAYHGLIRRRVAQTLGEAAAMLAMIAAAMFVIADPGATVGTLSQWSDEASLGSLNAIAGEGSAKPYAAFAAGMQQLYEAAIQAPWCFLEFGNVNWCDSPRRLDPRLHAAATAIAARIESEVQGSVSARGIGAEVLTHRVQLLRQAQSNGEIFLALPANGPLRNSVKDQGSLLYVLCGGAPDATRCQGPTAAEAEFRANTGTLPRIGGVLVIALGVLGMLLLVGFVALRLLEAAVVCVLFLVLAPAAALAPTLGEAGRAAFKRWAGRLLGAATAKLLWSVVLAALLTSMRLLLALQGVGWLTQWLLMSTLWWGVFLRRHGLLATVSAGHGDARVPRVGPLLEDAAVARGHRAGREAVDKWRSRKSKQAGSSPRTPPPQAPAQQDQPQQTRRLPRVPSSALDLEGVGRSDVGVDLALASASQRQTGVGQESPDGSAALEARLLRLRQAHADARKAGDAPRAASLARRMREVERQRERAATGVEIATAAGTAAKRAVDSTGEEAALPDADGLRQELSRPDAGTADSGRPSRRAPAAKPARRARPARTSRGAPLRGRVSDGGAADGGAEDGGAEDGGAEDGGAEDGGAQGSDARMARGALDRDLRARRQEQTPPSHPIMRDAFEVAQGRKRQLGYGREEDD